MTESLQPLPFTEHIVDPAGLTAAPPGSVPLGDRQGVFAHSFKCHACQLEFVLFSWRRDRHWVGSVCCPECGRATPMLHWRATLSTSHHFQEGSDEIYQHVPYGNAELLDDSTTPEGDLL